MNNSNEWKIEGFLGKYPKEGTTKTGKPYLIQSVSVYAGKDKETGKTKYDHIKFFVPQDDIQAFKNMDEGTLLELRGKPEANAYIDKEGELQKNLQMNLAWENSWNIIEKHAKKSSDQPSLEDFSDEPF